MGQLRVARYHTVCPEQNDEAVDGYRLGYGGEWVSVTMLRKLREQCGMCDTSYQKRVGQPGQTSVR